jgi:hypothetical protein
VSFTKKLHHLCRIESLALAFCVVATIQVGCRSTDSKSSDAGPADKTDADRPDAAPPDSGTGGQAARDSGSDASHDSGSDVGHDGDTDASQDSGTDAGHEAGTEAGHDAGTDASQDSGADASEDAGTDASQDSGTDAGHEAGEDAGTDASQDASTDASQDSGADASEDAGTDANQDASTDASGDAETDAGGEKTWGWISAIEWNDVCDQWYQKTQWFGGVRAYFSTAPEYNRALPHTLGFATARLSAGACTLYDSGLMSDDCLGSCLCLDKGVECWDTQGIERWCDEEHVCVADDPDAGLSNSMGQCVPLPPHFDVGDITITGLKASVTMTPDSLDRYIFSSPPEDLFDMGDTITASTSGGERPPMTFHAHGVAPLEVPDNVVRYRTGQPATVSWTPADPDSRVQIYLAAGSHDPNPLGGAILCDVPDSDGEVEMAADLLDQLWYLGCNGSWMIKCSRITRYSRDLQTGPGKEVELFVGSARNLQLLHE